MAETLSVIESRLRTNHPPPVYDSIGGERVAKTPEQYDAWIASSAVAEQTQQLADEAEAAHRAMVQQFTSGMTALRNDLSVVNTRITNNTNITNGEIKTGLRDLLQAVIWLGDRVADGTIETRKP